MTGDTKTDVLHIGENAELITRPAPDFAGLLDVDDPVETEASPTTMSALTTAADLMHGGYWRPAIVEAHVPEKDTEETVLAFVNNDDPTEVVLVCPAKPPEETKEATA